MFYELELKTHVRVSPELFNLELKNAIHTQLAKDFGNYVSKELGIVVLVSDIVEIGEGILIPGDGASYYDTTFKVYTFNPQLQEVLLGRISDIQEFGAFMEMGPIDGMIHLTQVMDDYVSFSKSNVLTGKESKKLLKFGDKCKARIIAISFKDPTNPKIGLTMRQPMLGKVEWLELERNEKNKK